MERRTRRLFDREVNRSVEAGTRTYLEDRATQAEEAAVHSEQGTVRKLTKIISDKCHTHLSRKSTDNRKGAGNTLGRTFPRNTKPTTNR